MPSGTLASYLERELLIASVRVGREHGFQKQLCSDVFIHFCPMHAQAAIPELTGLLPDTCRCHLHVHVQALQIVLFYRPRLLSTPNNYEGIVSRASPLHKKERVWSTNSCYTVSSARCELKTVCGKM